MRRPVGLGRTTPDLATRVRVCCLSLQRLGTAAAAAAAALRQVPRPSPPTSTHHQVFRPLSLPLLPCETEHPNPKLFGYLMPTNF